MTVQQDLLQKIETWDINIPYVQAGVKVTWTIFKEVDNGLLISCCDGMFVGFLYAKEVKELQKADVDVTIGASVEAEILSLTLKSEEGYYILSVIKLLQYDVWSNLSEKAHGDEIFTVIPTEANLGGLLVDTYGIKWFIPLSQLAPVNYPRVEDGDEEKIFAHLLDLIGKEFKVRVINIDEGWKRMILSEREALREEREKILEELEVWAEYEGIISGLSSYGLFVTIGWGIEWLVHISEITYGHVENIDRFWKVWDSVKVKVIGHEGGKISFSIKQMKWDPWSHIPEKFKVWDVIAGQVIRFVPYGVFMRVYEDINGLVHLSELSNESVTDPSKIVKFGQVINAKIISLDPSKRKIGLSMKGIDQTWATMAE